MSSYDIDLLLCETVKSVFSMATIVAMLLKLYEENGIDWLELKHWHVFMVLPCQILKPFYET